MCLRKAKKPTLAKLWFVLEDEIILNEVKKWREAILTSSKHKSGSDRIWEGFKKLGINEIDYILNLQGDEPNIDENDIVNLNNLMINHNSDIGTFGNRN